MVHKTVHEQKILVDDEWIAFRSWMPLAMTWPGWLSFCVLQWFGLRLDHKLVVEVVPTETSAKTQDQMPGFTLTLMTVARIRSAGFRFAWPLTGWCWNPGGVYNDPDNGVWPFLRRAHLRKEMVVPMLLSLPTLAAIAAVVWWLL